PAVRGLRPAPLLLGNRRHQFLRQGDLPPARHALHRGAAVPVGGRQGLDHGPRHRRTARLDHGLAPLRQKRRAAVGSPSPTRTRLAGVRALIGWSKSGMPNFDFGRGLLGRSTETDWVRGFLCLGTAAPLPKPVLSEGRVFPSPAISAFTASSTRYGERAQ